VIKAAVSI